MRPVRTDVVLQDVIELEPRPQCRTNRCCPGREQIADYQKKLDADPAQHFRSKYERLANARNIAKIIEPELPNQFRHIPAILYGVRAISADREAATATNGRARRPTSRGPGGSISTLISPRSR